MYILAVSLALAALPGPVIHTDDGPIQGEQVSKSDNFTTYHGVPFAAKVDSTMRFKPPQRATPWTEVKKTVKHGPQCPQFDFIKGVHVGDEDCLVSSLHKRNLIQVQILTTTTTFLSFSALGSNPPVLECIRALWLHDGDPMSSNALDLWWCMDRRQQRRVWHL
jgi:hypothetical protein